MGEKYYLVAFDSINYANYLEYELRKHGYYVDMLQTPEHVNKDYYVSLKIYEGAMEIAMEKIRDNNIERFKIYKNYLEDEKMKYKEIESKHREYDDSLLNIFLDEDEDRNEEDDISYDDEEIGGGHEIKARIIHYSEEEIGEVHKIDEEIVEGSIREEKNNLDNKKIETNLRGKGYEEESNIKSNRSISEDIKGGAKNKRKPDPIELIGKLYELKKKKLNQ